MKPTLEDDVANAVTGMLLGAVVGAGLGLGTCIWLLSEPPWFPGDTILIGAVLCGGLGWWFGDGFIDCLKECWHFFW